MESQTVSIFRENYKTYSEYSKVFQKYCLCYDYKVRVFGGWKFFTYKQDYEVWKNQK